MEKKSKEKYKKPQVEPLGSRVGSFGRQISLSLSFFSLDLFQTKSSQQGF